MKSALSVSAIVIVVVLMAQARAAQNQGAAQAPCALDGPRTPLGEDHWTGQAGHAFGYWSDEGKPSSYNFQLIVRNRAAEPLTFNWEGADFFRRGVAPGAEVRSRCRVDGNQPNIALGVIKYGANTQFPGPAAQFYVSQQVASLSGPENESTFEIRWTAILSGTAEYTVAVDVAMRQAAPNGIMLELRNLGDPVEIGWPAIISPVLLTAIREQSVQFVQDARIVLGRGGAIRAETSGLGTIGTMVAPLEIFSSDRVLLYRDRFAGLTYIGT